MAWRAWFFLALGVQWSAACFGAAARADGWHVFPGENIQSALDQAALNPTSKVVKVHAGVYRPDSKRQALIWFQQKHDGIRLEAVGDVTLTAANPELSDPKSRAHPAIVNHVVYFGDGVSSRTVLQGFKITGANHFVTRSPPEVEANAALEKGLFFYADGGAVKIFGRSYPTLRRLEIVDNYASPCAGGISVEHEAPARGVRAGAVRIEDCVFRQNRAQVTGAAVDLLPGSAAVISNCLFVANLGNLGVNYISENKTAPEFTNSAALTVFPGARAEVWNCTFTGNRNGVDDYGAQSLYRDCIFWRNTLGGAYYAGARYELEVQDQARVAGCFFGGPVLDPGGVISKTNNVFAASDPIFDAQFQPQSAAYRAAGFRRPRP